MGQFSHGLFQYKQRMASLFFFVSSAIPSYPISTIFLYYYYYYGDSERQEYNIHRLCQVQQIMYMNR